MSKSKKPREVTCEKCGELRPHHARQLCKNCYQQEYPGHRPIGNCKNGSLCKSGNFGVSVQIWARGMCRPCWNAWYNERKKLEKQFL